MSSLPFGPMAALLLCGASFSTAAPPGNVVIRNARIVPVSGPVIEKGAIAFRDGVITDVGASVAAPKGAWVIDGIGLTVYPGLIDAFSTWGIPGAAPATPQQRGSATTQSTPPGPRSWGPEDRPGTNSWVKAADLIDATDKRLESARSAGFTTAVTFPRQGLIGGHGAVVNLAGDNTGAMVLASSAGLYMTLSGGNYSGYPGTPMGAIAYFRQLWSDLDHYRTQQAMYAKSPSTVPRPAYDRALEGIANAPRLLLPASNPVQWERMARLAAELKIPAVFWGVQEGWRMADRVKQSGSPVILNVKWPVREKDSDPEQEDTYKTLELRDKAPDSPAAMSAAGVTWAVSSDGLDSPKDILKALKKSIDAGLKRDDAVRALTLNAAEIYGLAGRLGSLDRGKIANLIVTDGDIFDDKTTVRMIFIDGVKYEPAPEPPPANPAVEVRP